MKCVKGLVVGMVLMMPLVGICGYLLCVGIVEACGADGRLPHTLQGPSEWFCRPAWGIINAKIPLVDCCGIIAIDSGYWLAGGVEATR